MPWVGFEPTISAGERPKTYALDRAATGTGISTPLDRNILLSTRFFKTQPLSFCETENVCGVVMKLFSDRNYLHFCATAKYRKISDSEAI